MGGFSFSWNQNPIALLCPLKMSENNLTLMHNFFKWWVATQSFVHLSRKERWVEPHSTGHWTRSLMGSKILFAIFNGGLYLIATSLLLCLVIHTKCYSFDALNPHWNFSIEALLPVPEEKLQNISTNTSTLRLRK